MAESKFSLGDYVEVKDRIRLFYEAHPDGRLVTDEVRISVDDDTPRVLVKALAYRTADDPLPAVGWSWMELPGKTTYTKGSELENTETSAWGRAIGALGIGIAKSIASANEVRSKEAGPAPKTDAALSVVHAEGGLIGVASVGKMAPVDGELRETPQGWSVGFVIGEGRDKVQVVAYDTLGEALHPLVATLVGQRVQVFGHVSMEKMRVGAHDREFPRMTLDRIVTPDWTMPAEEAVPADIEELVWTA